MQPTIVISSVYYIYINRPFDPDILYICQIKTKFEKFEKNDFFNFFWKCAYLYAHLLVLTFMHLNSIFKIEFFWVTYSGIG